jgi:hypothetical protein
MSMCLLLNYPLQNGLAPIEAMLRNCNLYQSLRRGGIWLPFPASRLFSVLYVILTLKESFEDMNMLHITFSICIVGLKLLPLRRSMHWLRLYTLTFSCLR